MTGLQVERYITQVMNSLTNEAERSVAVSEVAGLDEGGPLFAQVAERLAGEIADGGLAEGERVPSTNELAAFYRINPATAAKGVNQLVADGILYKKRGIGMFVAADARDRVLHRRREAFGREFVGPLVEEAKRLGLTAEDLKKLIETWGDMQ